MFLKKFFCLRLSVEQQKFTILELEIYRSETERSPERFFEDVPLVEFMYLVHTPGESYRGLLRSLLLCLCCVLRALINSLVC